MNFINMDYKAIIVSGGVALSTLKEMKEFCRLITEDEKKECYISQKEPVKRSIYNIPF